MRIIVDKNIPLVEKAFGAIGDVKAIETTEFETKNIREADVLIVRSETKVNGALLDGTRVKFVGTATIGTDHLDLDYLASQSIVYANAPGCNSNSVKEYVVAALLHLSRTLGFSLKGKTLGVVGVGNVGSKVVKAAEALGMTVLQNDPPRARVSGGHQFVPFEAILTADIVSLHVPLTKKGSDVTFHLFDREKFQRLKPGVIFMNSSRGAVVETESLKKAIAEKRLAATIIDVWEKEPNIDADLLPLTSIATPHIAGYSTEGKLNAVVMIRETLCRHFSISSDWNPEGDLPLMGDTNIRLSGDKLPAEELLYRAVKLAYDLALDDEQMRKMLTLPPEKRGEYFMRLRTGYRMRREFKNWIVQLPKIHESLKQTLEALGFQTNAV
jgi:erythronate-4-phosphate dehydrogenase